MKKKVLAITLAVGMAAGLLAGCGGKKETSVVGEWGVTKIKMEGMDEAKPVREAVEELAESSAGATEEEIQQAVDMLTQITLVINEDGTMSANAGAIGIEQDGTWEETDDNTYSLTSDEGDVLVLTLEGDELVTEADGEMLVFEK